MATLPHNPPVFPPTVSALQVINPDTWGNVVQQSLMEIWLNVQAINNAPNAVVSVFGRTGTITAQTGDYTAAQVTGAVINTRQIIAGTGLTGGGDLAADRSLSVVADTTVQRVDVSRNGTSIASRRRLNFIEGSNVTLAVADDSGNNRTNITINATAGGGGGTTPTFQVAGSTAGTRNTVNFIAGTNVTIVGADDAGNNRVNITINATPGSGSPQTPWASNINGGGFGLSNVSTIATTGNVTAGGLVQLAASGLRFSDASTLTSAAGLIQSPLAANIDANQKSLTNLATLGVSSSATGTFASAVTIANTNVGAQVLAGNVRLTVKNALNANSFLTMISSEGLLQETTRFDFRADGNFYVTGSITIANGGINSPNYSGLAIAGNATAPAANELIRSSSDGHTYFGFINTPSGDAGTATPTKVYASFDNFIRYWTLANFSAKVTPDWSNIQNKPAIVAANGTTINGKLSISNNTGATAAFGAVAIEVREVSQVLNTQTGTAYAPRIAFHWGNVAAAQWGLDSGQTFRAWNQAGDGYVDVGASSFVASANVTAGAAITAGTTITATGDITSASGFRALNVSGAPGILIGEGVGNNQFCRVEWNNASKYLQFSFSPGGPKLWLSAAYTIMSLPTSSAGLPTGALWRSGNDVKIV